MGKIKTYIIIGASVLIILLAGCFMYSVRQLKSYREKYDIEYANNKALEAENNSMSDDIEVLRYSVKDIKASNDSLIQEMYKLNKKLKKKDKDIKQLQYMLSTAEKTDSLILRDTIFISDDIHIDTIIGDEWMNTRLQLDYPSSIKVTPSVKSEKMVLMNGAKKIKGTPSKVFFIRWFQKKYTTIEVDIIEKNPYIVNDKSRFIEVVD